jgi:NodT family efflux transporter outer membrane factor (OMF) lipoprotein
MKARKLRHCFAGIGPIVLLAGCMVGPDYHRPSVPVPAKYKEISTIPVGWKDAAPADDLNRGSWWSIYNDAVLNDLAAKIAIDNQNLKAYEAAYRQAVALADEAQSSLYPSVSLAPSVTRSRSIGGTGINAAGSATTNSAGGTTTIRTLAISAGWDLDIWGKIRRQIQSNRAAVQASGAQLASARLSAQAELATDYFQLRYEDSLQHLLSETVAAYERTLAITRNQYSAGIAARSATTVAETQLQTTRSQLIAVGVSRAQYAHAIALLMGQSASDVDIPVAQLAATVPVIPLAIPSALLERRPDIAEAERTVAQENALIGVAVAAYYPDISLSGLFGYAGSPATTLVSASTRAWSAAASGNQVLFDGGARSASVAAARAAYDQSVANYRQTVLTAFHDVEDALSNLRILGEQAEAQARAVALSKESVEIALHEYEAGTQAYTAVVTAQATALANEETQLQIAASRLTSSVALLKAMGGGWGPGS